MKRIKFIAIAAVLTFGIGGAVVANQLADPQANVMNIGSETSPNWVPITPGHSGCDEETTRPCTGYQDPNTGLVSTLAKGNELP